MSNLENYTPSEIEQSLDFTEKTSKQETISEIDLVSQKFENFLQEMENWIGDSNIAYDESGEIIGIATVS